MQGIKTFYIWTITQIISLIGSRMTSVALGIWLFMKTGNTTPVLLVSFFIAVPQALVGSFAGVFADRWPRRTALLLCQCGQSILSILLLAGFLSGQFQLWHLYAIALAQGALLMIQEPAISASITMLVPEAHRQRANTLRQLSGPLAGVIAPALAGFLFTLISITGIILIDLLTYICAAIVLWIIRIPEPGRDGQTATSVIDEAKVGFRFLQSRRVLLFLMIYAAVLNFLLAGPINLATPYLIKLTGSEQLLGILLGVMNLGMIIGGILTFIFGGTHPRIHGIMLGLLFRAFWLMMYGLARTPVVLGITLFFLLSTNALIDGSLMSVMQDKVPPHMQGRIFALLYQMMYIANPLSLLVTGFLVDHVFEPSVGHLPSLVGNVPGSGMGLLIVISGATIFVMTLIVYAQSRVRHFEAEMPDYAVDPGATQ